MIKPSLGSVLRESPEYTALALLSLALIELKAAGYRNAVFGKWGLGANQDDGTPLQRGYDEFLGYMNHWHAHQAFPDYIWDGLS